MALINCPECGKEISNTVSKCIHCGYTVKTPIDPKKRKVIVSVIAALFCLSALVYGFDYVWNLSSVFYVILGICLVAFYAFADKILPLGRTIGTSCLLVLGSFMLTFHYNIGRLDLDYGFFSGYFYSGTRGVILAMFQIVAVAATVLALLALFVKKIPKGLSATILVISGVFGGFFHIFDKISLGHKYSSFHIWIGVTTLIFFVLMGTVFITDDK